MAGLFFEIHPEDSTNYLAVTTVLWVVALAADYPPARRATKIDPMIALRFE
jgi:ABC-type lipoprotein release transport system permease subunit